MMHDFFNLGPYRDFIWPAYAVSGLALGVLTVWAVASWRRAKRRLIQLGGRL